MTNFQPRPGAVRYQDADGNWHCANPRDLLFSTVTMLATHFWTGDDWQPIWSDDDLPDGFGAEEAP